jgi:hypothetical protein
MGNSMARKQGNKTNSNSSLNLGVGLSSNNSNKYGTIRRSSSTKRTDQGVNNRPSTAPHKNEENTLTNQNSMKRLPSPVVKCKIFLIYNIFS